MHAHARAPVHSFTSLSVHCFLSSPSLSLTWYKESFSSFSHTLYCAALIPFSSSLSIFPFTVSEAVTDIGEKQSMGSSFQHPHAWTRTQTNTAAAWMRTCNNSTLTRGALLWYSRRWALCVCMIIICPLLMFVYWTEWVCVSVCVCVGLSLCLWQSVCHPSNDWLVLRSVRMAERGLKHNIIHMELISFKSLLVCLYYSLCSLHFKSWVHPNSTK